MKKKPLNLEITFVLADGSVMSDAEFMSGPFVVSFEKNKELYHEIETAVNPAYRLAETKRREREKVDDRLAKLRWELRRAEAGITN